MNYYSIPTFFTSFLVFTLGLTIYVKGQQNKASLIYFLLSLSIFTWLFFVSVGYNCSDLVKAELYMRICYLGIVFIPITTLHFDIEFLKILSLRLLIPIIYGFGFLFWILLIKTNYIVNGLYKYFWGVYPKAGALHPAFLIFLFFVASISIALLINSYFRIHTSSIRKIQIKYILMAYFFLLASTIDFIQVYGVSLYPFGYIPVTIFLIFIAYATIKYRLLDITVAITRTGVFITVYSLVLGTPFIIAYALKPYLLGFFGDKWWLVPMGLLTVLATVGPFIFIYINKKAEDRLLQEQRRYQHTLRQASSGMIRIRELRKLLDLIVYVVTKTVKIEFSAMFLMDSGNNHYSMVAKRGALNLAPDFSLDTHSPLIQELYLKREPIVYEEVQLQSQDSPHDSRLMHLEKHLKEINASVIVPSYVGNKLLGFLVLGKKLSGKIYSQDDLNVFSVLANQAALAIENAQFYEDIKQTQQQLFQAEKMATVGTMADGLSHQINNRFQALSLIAGDSMDVLKTTDVSNCSPEVKDSLEQLKYAFERIQANVMQGGEVVKGLLRYSRPGQEGFEPTDFNLVIDGALEMVQYKVRIKEIDVAKNIPADLPKLKCNLTQLQEVFFNLIDNAYDAIKERQTSLKEPDYKGRIEISAAQQDSNVRIIFKDNGIGVKGKDKEHLFTPFFTTKATGKKGTGLGLYVIQKIVNFHNGTISIDSTYQVGTTFEIGLPLSR